MVDVITVRKSTSWRRARTCRTLHSRPKHCYNNAAIGFQAFSTLVMMLVCWCKLLLYYCNYTSTVIIISLCISYKFMHCRLLYVFIWNSFKATFITTKFNIVFLQIIIIHMCLDCPTINICLWYLTHYLKKERCLSLFYSFITGYDTQIDFE